MTLGDRFDRALLFASTRHRGHRRKNSDVPYVAHLLSVAALVLTHGGGEDEAVAALLHDCVEDGKASAEEIGREFGPEVARIVAGCTEPGGDPRPPWRQRKEAYIAHLRQGDPSVCLVAGADKLDNARAVVRDYRILGDDLWRRFHAGRDEQLWFYAAVRDTLRGRVPDSLMTELDEAVEQLLKLAGESHA